MYFKRRKSISYTQVHTHRHTRIHKKTYVRMCIQRQFISKRVFVVYINGGMHKFKTKVCEIIYN
jgi:hypothetical protein